MVGRHDAYSQLIAAIKMVLPLVALGILASLFLLSRPAQQGEPLRYADGKIEEKAEQERVSNLDYRSVTDAGSIVRLQAVEMNPDPGIPELYHGIDLVGRIEPTADESYDLFSDFGWINEQAGLSRLEGDVRVVRADGYVLTTETVSIRTDLTYLETLHPVRIDGPLGTLDADRMEMIGRPELGDGALTVFKGNVRVLYDPE